MIKAYHRPESLNEALALLARAEPPTVPLGGGTVLSRQRKPDVDVVDLRRLGLNTIEAQGQTLALGATVTLQQLLAYTELPASLAEALGESLRLEAAFNLRQTATLGGTLVSCDGRSPFVTALLALDPRLEWASAQDAPLAARTGQADEPPQDELVFAADDVPPPGDSLPLGDFLPLRQPLERGRLITGLRLPLNARLAFASVARAPKDRPIVCAAVAVWPSGRTRVALGGFGPAPILAMDGPEVTGAGVAAREAYRFAGDEWASADYRKDVAGKLVGRLCRELKLALEEKE